MDKKSTRTAKQFILMALLTFLTAYNAKAAPYTLTASDVTIDENGYITACTYDFSNTDIIIPATIGGQTIKGIADATEPNYYATGIFYRKGITGLQLPSTIEYIGCYAFNFNNITDIDFSNFSALKTIANDAFNHNSIVNVKLNNCSALETIEMRGFYNNSTISSVDFTGCTSLHSIGEDAFSYNAIDDLDLSGCVSLFNIDRNAFNHNNFTSFTLPSLSPGPGYEFFYWEDNNGTQYGDGATVSLLANSYSAHITYTLQSDDVVMENGVIQSCSYNLVVPDIIIPGTLDGQQVTGIAGGAGAFDGMFYDKAINSIKFPSTIITIGNNVFYDSDLTSIDLSECTALTTIGSAAFFRTNLSSVDFSHCTSLVTIGSAAFRHCNLTRINLSNCTSLVDIVGGAFANNTIDGLDFSSCTSLETIDNIAFDYNNINNYVDLRQCTHLTRIGSSAFTHNYVSGIRLPRPTKEGATFVNWSDGTYTYSGGSTASAVTSDIRANFTYPITITVTDGTNPIVGATIEMSNGDERTTGENGVATFNLLGRNYYSYTITKNTYKSKGRNLHYVDSAINVTDTLQPVVVTINVNDGTNPVAGATLAAGQNIFGTTDANGQLVLVARLYGSSFYTLTADGYRTTTILVNVWNADVTQTFSIDPINATITVSDGSNAFEGATVTLDGQKTVTTNASGQAIFSVVTNGDHNYSSTADGYKITTGTFTVSNNSVSRTAYISPVTVSLRVNDGSTPVAGAAVTFDGQSIGTTNTSGVVSTSPVGSGNHTYTATAAGYTPVTGTITVNKADVEETVSIRSTNSTVTLTITNGTNLIQGARVIFEGATYTSNASGQVTISTTNGDHSYSVTSNGYKIAIGTITVNDADVTETITITPVTVTFLVTDGTSAIPGAAITLNGNNIGTADTYGKLSIERIENGTHSYTVTLDGFVTASGTITVSNYDVEKTVTISRIRVSFTVRYAPNNIIQGANITLDGQSIGNTNINGQLTALMIGNGTHNYTVTANGFKQSSGTFTVDNGNVSETVIMEPVRATFIVAEGSNPFQGALLVIGVSQIGLTNVSGQVSAARLTNGNHSYIITAPGYKRVNGTITINGDDITETVSISPLTVTFTINDGSNPVVGASVTINGQNIGTTNASGQISVSKLNNGIRTYTVSANGYKEASGTISINNDDVSQAVSITPVSATFTVNDGSNAIANASVNIDGVVIGATDANGQLIASPIANGNHNYTVTATGYKPVSGSVTVNSADVTETVTLNPVVLNFTVTDGSNALAGVSISIDGQNLSTNANGEASVTGIENGSYNYTVATDGYKPVLGSVTINSADVEETVVLSPVVLTFTVTDGSDALVGVTVNLEGQNLTTDANGQVTVSEVGNGTFNYTVSADGYKPVSGSVIINSADVEETVVLSPVVVTFTVTDGSNALAGVTVNLEGQNLTTDANGQVSVSQIGNGSFNYTASVNGYESTTGNFTVNSADVNVDVTMNPVVVTLTITDGTNAIEGATVIFDGITYSSDANGMITISTVVDGIYSYSAEMEGYEATSGSITVSDDDVSETIILTLIPVYNVSFTISDGSNAIEGAEVTFNGAVYKSNASGIVTINNLVDGSYDYSLTASGYEAASGSVTVEGEDVTETITLTAITTPVYDVTFTITDGTNAIEGAVVTFAGSDYTGDANGEVLIVNLADGSYDYSISADGYATFSGSVTVEGDDVSETITLTGLTSLENSSITSIEVYPNPASDYIHIGNAEGLSAVVIYNALGQQQIAIEFDGAGNTTSINVSALKDGLYLMQYTINGATRVKQIVIK